MKAEKERVFGGEREGEVSREREKEMGKVEFHGCGNLIKLECERESESVGDMQVWPPLTPSSPFYLLRRDETSTFPLTLQDLKWMSAGSFSPFSSIISPE